jgi:putative membrane protein
MPKQLMASTALTLALAGSSGGIALAQQADAPQVTPAGEISAEDQEFLTQAIQAGVAEVQISELALVKSSDEEVRGFAERMVQDHTAANEQLSRLAQAAGNTPPAEMDDQHQNLHQQLSQLSEEDFDQQYMQGQVQAHQAAVELFSSEANQPSGPVDQLAGELLPTLQQHLQMAQEIRESIASE